MYRSFIITLREIEKSMVAYIPVPWRCWLHALAKLLRLICTSELYTTMIRQYTAIHGSAELTRGLCKEP